MSDLAAALQIAIKVHADQRDKQGEPYLLHVLRVVNAVEGERAKVLAALHDVMEDAVVVPSLEETFEENGMWIENSVEVLTRSPKETYAEYIQGIRDGHSSTWVAEIREVKLADLRDNLSRIPPGPYNECGGREDSGGEGSMAAYEPNWRSLKARYEKAIATLEAA
jgi:(p)ppGpp synthase/HD superfamily hydrolase